MRLEHYPEKKLKKELLDILGRHLDLKEYKVFFFGSRVAGTGDERADIDVGIAGPRPLSIEKMADIREAIEEIPTLYHIDVVDFTGADEDFREVAQQHTEVISSP